MVIVQLKGGLGNQMFQFAAAKLLGAHINKDIKIDVSFFNEASKSVTKREYYLDFYHINDIVIHKTRKKTFFQKCLFKIGYPLLKATNHRLVLRGVEKSKLNYYKKFKKVILNGYFLDLKLLESNQNLVKSIFQFNEHRVHPVKKLKEMIQNTQSVSLHVRRGDYLNQKNQHIYYTCEVDYYKRAIEHIYSKLDKPHFFVFSDDLEWARKELGFNGTTEYIDVRSHDKDVLEFFLMSNCKHNIIANSTYSWWAAYLNRNPEKIVLAPEIWYKNEEENKKALQLVPEEWKVL